MGPSAAPLFALAAAAGFALNLTLSRLGLREASPSIGVYWSMLTSASLLTVVSLVRGVPRLEPSTVGLVVAAGIVASVVGRYSAFRGSFHLGPSRAAAIQASTYPSVTVLGGVLLLGERLTPVQVGGIALLLLSLRLVLGGAGAGAAPARPRDVNLVFPFLAGTAFGAADLLRRTAVGGGEDALTAATVGALVAVGVWVSIVARSGGIPALVRPPRGIGWLVASGAASATALSCSFLALSLGSASVVGPIIASQPVFVAAFSALLLGRLESRTRRTLLGVLTVTAGAIVLSLAR